MIKLSPILNEVVENKAVKLLNDFAKEYKASSYYAYVYKNGNKLFEYSKNAEKNSVFGIGSVSKGMDKIAIMKLIEMGKLKLDDKIMQFGLAIPKDGINLVNYYDWEGWETITIKDLMLHKSGIADLINDIPDFNFHYGEFGKIKDPDHLLVMRAIAKYPLKFKPGTQENYSNTNFYLICKIIEFVMKKPYGDCMKELIFDPLEMKNTTWAYKSTKPKGLVKGYVLDKETNKLLQPFKIKPFDAYAIFYSSPEDMLKLGEAYINDKIISDKTRKMFFYDPENSPGQNGSIHDGYTCRWDAYADDGNKVVFIVVINVFGQTVSDPFIETADSIRDLFVKIK